MRALKREYLSVVELDFHGEEEEDGHEDRREAKGGLLLHCSSWKRLSELGFLISFALFWFFVDAEIEGGESAAAVASFGYRHAGKYVCAL